LHSASAYAADLGGSLKDPPAVQVAGAPSGWQFAFTTYGWLPWITGSATIRGRSVTIDVSPKDVIDALDWSQIPAWMSYAEARNGRLSLFNDIVYAKLAGSANFAKSVTGRIGAAALAGRIEADYEQAIVEVGAGYEIWSTGAAAAGRAALDIIAGGRYWYQNASVSADLAATLAIAGPGGIVDLERSGARVAARSRSIEWVDPFVGARVRYQLSPGRGVNVRGDVGGFGAGSDFSWQLMGTIDWQLLARPGYTFDAYLGYRALSVDYSKGSGTNQYRFDATQHGPVVGGTLRF
jgi:hypothetical protein